ncbi:MAG: cobalamin B12-binding domain-containing protein [Deltaproteobacteria bacterium]|nr:cobalamin B12-binding domain-containing protein [Deltaproteobacteria bacterium]
MRIALVAIHPCPSPQAVPLANAFLKGFADDARLKITLLDLFAGQAAADCAAEIVALRPDAVGFSMYVWNRAICLEIARELARRLPGVTIFAGGPEVTADPGGVLSAAPLAFLIVGEGERPFAAACNRLAAGQGVEGIPGVVAGGKDGPQPTPPGEPLDLDVIPSPWLSGVLDTRRYPGVLWQLARGCGFACDFCFDARGSRGVRRFSLDRVEAELRHFAATGVSQVFVLDSTFNQDSRRAKAILRLIARIAPRIHFHFEVRCEFIDREMARLFARITCSLQIGLQSADPGVLRNVGRAFRRDDFAARVDLLNESGAVFGFDLMYGLPGDTLKGFGQSLDFALGLYPNHLDIFPLAVLPGTALAGRGAALGLQHLPDPPYTLISSPSFSAEDMALARQLASACDIFYTRGKAVAWFNPAVAALGLKPSAFLRAFGEWLAAERGEVNEADLADHEIRELQRAFLTKVFSGKGVRRLLPLVLDLVDYHYHYAAAVQAPPPSLPARRKPRRILDTPLALAPSSRLAVFHYEILDILEGGAPDLRALADSLSPSGSRAVIYPAADGVRTESLAEPYFRLLEGLDGRTPAGRITERLGIPEEEARPFLEFALAEGIVTLLC